MLRPNASIGRPARLGCGCLAAALVACLGLSGCSTLGRSNYDFSHVEGLSDSSQTGLSREFRPPDNQLLPHAVTNKGMQIERSLGVP
jgi:hypothetical protein